MLKLLMHRILIAIAVIFVSIQAWPYGRNHTNPPVRREPAWDSLQTRHLAVRACFDCHSNETAWPWYSNIAPFLWLIQSDVVERRRKVNYSEWDRPQKGAKESAETVQEETMPPWYYVIIHPQAKLSSVERQALVRGLGTTFGLGDLGKREDREEREKEVRDGER